MPEFEDQQPEPETDEAKRDLQRLAFNVLGAIIMAVIFGFRTGHIVIAVVLLALGFLYYGINAARDNREQ